MATPYYPGDRENISRKRTLNMDNMGEDDKEQFPQKDESSESSRATLNKPDQQFANAREYAQALRPWLWHQQNLIAIQSFAANFAMQMHMISALNALNNNYCSSFTPASHIGTNSDPYASRRAPVSQQIPRAGGGNVQQQQVGNQPATGQGVVFKVPTVWKRVAAELIDFTCLFYLKMLVSICVMSDFSLDHIIVINTEDLLESFNELDYDRAFAITFEVIALEIINRILITIFETLCLYHTTVGGVAIGATPGKRLMGLRVVSCDSAQSLGLSGQVLVSPAGNVSLKSAFLRSLIKNFTIAFFLPACLTLFIFNHNRTAYDVIAHTIVVEDAV